MTVRGGLLAAAAALLAVAAPVAVTSAQTANGERPPAASAVQTMSRCVERVGHLLVYFQIDRSGSLASNDPHDRRVDGIDAALIGLTRTADTDAADGEPVRVEALLGSFAGTVEPAAPASHWRSVDDRSEAELLSRAKSYADRDDARDTDYVLALEGAHAALEQRAAAVATAEGVEPCKAILFLTDGRYRLRDRTGGSGLPSRIDYAPGIRLDVRGGGARAVAAGRRALCRPDGVMDRIVDDRIVTFTVALSGSKRFTAVERDFLRALTTGAAGDRTCGTRLSPATGQFVDVRQARSLAQVFSNLTSAPKPIDTPPVCPTRPCPKGIRDFTAVPGLRGFELVASMPRRGVALVLTDPAGGTTTLASADEAGVTTSGASIHQRWIRSRALDLQGRFDQRSEAWQGRWQLAFVEPSGRSVPPASYTVRLQPDLQPAVLDSPRLAAGDVTEIPVEIVDGSGERVDEGALVSSMSLTASVVGPDGDSRRAAVRGRDDGTFVVDVAIPAGAPTDEHWQLDVEASFAAADGLVESAFSSFELEGPSGGIPLWVLLLAAGLPVAAGLGVAAFYRHRRNQARFTPPQQLLALSRDVEIRPGTRVRLDPDTAAVARTDLDWVSRDGEDASVPEIDYDVFHLRARVSWLPTAEPYGVATSDGCEVIGGSSHSGRFANRDGHSACVVPFSLPGTWLLAVDRIDDYGDVHGRLAVFVSEDDANPGMAASEVLAAARVELVDQDWDGFASVEDDLEADLEDDDDLLSLDDDGGDLFSIDGEDDDLLPLADDSPRNS